MEAIRAENLWKTFRLSHGRPGTLKGILMSSSKVTYETLHALQDVNFSVQSGETLSIIGKNGSGKSTLLSLIAGVYKPSQGKIEVTGRISALLELGAGFHEDLTGIENIYLNSSILGLGRRETEKRFNDIVEFAELERFIDSPIRTYSSGMMMRLAFSIAVQVDPDILLVDEVLAVGDVAFQKKCMTKIHEFKEQGKTIVLVSHSGASVVEVTERAIWLENGVMKADGDSKSVMQQYLVSQGLGVKPAP